MNDSVQNLSIWSEVFTTDPSRVKPISGGRLGAAGLSSSNPYFSVFRATALWGPCGSRWGVEPLETLIGERWTYCRVKLFYPWNGKTGTVYHWGCANTGPEGPKMALTNGTSKALSMLGFCGDVHAGLFDDPAYVRSLVQQQAPPPPPPAQQAPQQEPLATREELVSLGTRVRAFQQEFAAHYQEVADILLGSAGRALITQTDFYPNVTQAEVGAAVLALQDEAARRREPQAPGPDQVGSVTAGAPARLDTAGAVSGGSDFDLSEDEIPF